VAGKGKKTTKQRVPVVSVSCRRSADDGQIEDDDDHDDEDDLREDE
jgi:hypothetical protein